MRDCSCDAKTWEQREFSSEVSLFRGLTYSPNDIVSGGVRVLRSSNINEDTFVLSEDDVFVRKDAINISYTQNKDILITAANGSTRLVGKHALVTDLKEKSTVHGGFMLLARANNPEFINASMSSRWYTQFIAMYVAGGNGAIGNISKSDLEKQILLIPKVEEKKKIGSLFSKLDQLITLHQRARIN
jgi:type I restriction enzyme S subunit